MWIFIVPYTYRRHICYLREYHRPTGKIRVRQFGTAEAAITAAKKFARQMASVGHPVVCYPIHVHPTEAILQ